MFGALTTLLVTQSDATRLIAALNTQQFPGGFWLPRPPEDYYTFAGEIPWSPDFGRAEGDDSPSDPYRGTMNVNSGTDVEVEILAHRYVWESRRWCSEHGRRGPRPNPLVFLRFRSARRASIIRPARTGRSAGSVVIRGVPPGVMAGCCTFAKTYSTDTPRVVN